MFFYYFFSVYYILLHFQNSYQYSCYNLQVLKNITYCSHTGITVQSNLRKEKENNNKRKNKNKNPQNMYCTNANETL